MLVFLGDRYTLFFEFLVAHLDDLYHFVDWTKGEWTEGVGRQVPKQLLLQFPVA
jgi:hypothetical protein